MSIISFGLGGDATGMILNRFNLGGFDITIVIDPEPERGGKGTPRGRGKREEPHQLVTISIRYNNKEWEHKYLWRDNYVDAYIRTTGVISTVIRMHHRFGHVNHPLPFDEGCIQFIHSAAREHSKTHAECVRQ